MYIFVSIFTVLKTLDGFPAKYCLGKSSINFFKNQDFH